MRELENAIERAVVLCRDEVISARHFQFEREGSDRTRQTAGDQFTPGLTLREMEKRLILSTLTVEGNNRTRASDVLGISVRTLRNKLNEYSAEGITVP